MPGIGQQENVAFAQGVCRRLDPGLYRRNRRLSVKQNGGFAIAALFGDSFHRMGVMVAAKKFRRRAIVLFVQDVQADMQRNPVVQAGRLFQPAPGLGGLHHRRLAARPRLFRPAVRQVPAAVRPDCHCEFPRHGGKPRRARVQFIGPVGIFHRAPDVEKGHMRVARRQPRHGQREAVHHFVHDATLIGRVGYAKLFHRRAQPFALVRDGIVIAVTNHRHTRRFPRHAAINLVELAHRPIHQTAKG